jgi:glyoxylase-like metal-dependent hydrolase (beta-lactamase superfamily II)
MTVDPIIPFVRDMSFDYGVAEQVSPLVRRIVARNPGPFTFHGTGTYIIGSGNVAVVDPGPLLDDHVDALTAALNGEEVSHILVTHTHHDHSAAARVLQARTGGKIHAFDRHGSGRHERGLVVEEGADWGFVPDIEISDSEMIEGHGWSVEAIHTPGHTSNHLCFHLREENALFCGDHVMGWSTTIVSPPDGEMRPYVQSLRNLLDREDAVYWPTHGPPIRDPRPFVAALIDHREHRLEQILDCLDTGVETIPEMVPRVYHDIPAMMHPAAARSVLASLIALVEDGRVTCDGEPRARAHFAKTA